MSELILPRGCTVKQHSALEAYTSRLFFPSNTDRQAWDKEYGLREQGMRQGYEQIVRFCLIQGSAGYMNLAEPLATVNEDTGLTNGVLLSQGLTMLGRERFVLTTSNRLGMDATNRGALFALGEKMQYKGKMELKWETRSVEADIIGVVLNTGLKAARLKPGQFTNISADQVYSLLEAVVAARVAYIKAEEKGNMDKFFTQDEFDQATDWILFGSPTPFKDS